MAAATATAAAPQRDQPLTLGERLRHPTWGGSVGLLVVTGGWLVGLRPLMDNSFLTHLATGRIILESGSVPSHDAYTFTAAGEPWVVQSWLPSVLYANAERLAGLDGVRIVVGVLAALLCGLAWSLLREADSLVPRLAAAGLFVGVGASLWAERPLMVGLNCVALVLLASEGRLDPRWLLPMGWIWVNSHGSFPLGVVVLLVSALGRRMDRGPVAQDLKALQWLVPGILLGAVGPLGLRVLVFPVELLRNQDVLHNVIEWRAPTFDAPSQQIFIVQLALAIVLVARRPSYRAGLIVAVFGSLALLGLRNVTLASLVFLPVMAPGLKGFGSLSSRDRAPAARLMAIAGVATISLFTVTRFNQADLDLGIYPVPALSYLESNEVDTREVRLAAPDFVGNLIDYIYGPEQRTYYDDRFDMFPLEVTAAQQALISAGPTMREDLDELDIDMVLLERASPNSQIILGDPEWRALFQDGEWVLSCRRGADLGGQLGRC